MKTSFKAGMYLLETLTTGMYNEPLSIYREYIQNSVDSIDIMNTRNKRSFMVNIELDPFDRKITIIDNGFGLKSADAEQILCSIGSSNKVNSNLRGFRGIGRLGGIAFSDKVIFQTKSEEEVVESIQEWDCTELRKHLSNPDHSEMSLNELLKKITTFTQINGKKKSDSYFKVTLEGVTSFRNYIFDINKIKNYLSKITPVPFNGDKFQYGKEIDSWLVEKLNNYGVYNILLNGEPIYKPYKDSVNITKKGYDYIEGIRKFEIKIKSSVVAYGWYGIRKNLLGAIAKGENSSGIRVRVGNILIGDSHLLDGCFRESRFNSYVVGEIHVESPYLIPNSRRDDFIDNEYKTLFYNAVEREIGLDISKEIRSKSRKSYSTKENKDPMVKKEKVLKNDQIKGEKGNSEINTIDDIIKLCGACQNLPDVLQKLK